MELSSDIVALLCFVLLTKFMYMYLHVVHCRVLIMTHMMYMYMYVHLIDMRNVSFVHDLYQ